jgi:uncharacterized protein YfaA (DUF2138 family)
VGGFQTIRHENNAMRQRLNQSLQSLFAVYWYQHGESQKPVLVSNTSPSTTPLVLKIALMIVSVMIHAF